MQALSGLQRLLPLLGVVGAFGAFVTFGAFGASSQSPASASASSSTPASAPGTTSSSALAPVEVTGFKNAARSKYERLLAGAEAFVSHHALAPNAELRFETRSTSASTTPLLLRLDNDDRVIAIELDRNGGFALPPLAAAGRRDGEIVSNRRAGELKIVPVVRSPGSTDVNRRLGDVRALCEVFWAIEKDDWSFVSRQGVALLGGICRSDRIGLYFQVPRKLSGAVVTFGERREPVPLRDDHLAYRPPIHDASWPDDARLELSFEGPMPQCAVPATASGAPSC